MKPLVLCIIILVSVILKDCIADIYSDLVREEWNTFKLEYDKTYYGEIEENYRFKIFIGNMRKIQKHNQLFELGIHTYKLGVNQFTDMFESEINKQMNRFNSTVSKQEHWRNRDKFRIYDSPVNSLIDLPTSINWIEKGAVTYVKNQGQCGSCYAFSAVGALEAQLFLTTNNLIPLSEQNIVDCSEEYGNHGCNGGWMVSVFNYILNNGGIDTEYSYPYKGVQDVCKYDWRSIGASIKTYGLITIVDEIKLMEFVATVGPISVGIDASHPSFHMYANGIYYEPECNEMLVNHAVLIVGYGTENGVDYWLVKNSWGSQWGENGYIKMARNENNNCCVACHASYPILK